MLNSLLARVIIAHPLDKQRAYMVNTLTSFVFLIRLPIPCPISIHPVGFSFIVGGENVTASILDLSFSHLVPWGG